MEECLLCGEIHDGPAIPYGVAAAANLQDKSRQWVYEQVKRGLVHGIGPRPEGGELTRVYMCTFGGRCLCSSCIAKREEYGYIDVG